jgi:hypothetical protein
MKALMFVKDRMLEPSTYAGLAAVAAVLNTAPFLPWSQAAVMLFGALAVFLKEKHQHRDWDK